MFDVETWVDSAEFALQMAGTSAGAKAGWAKRRAGGAAASKPAAKGPRGKAPAKPKAPKKPKAKAPAKPKAPARPKAKAPKKPGVTSKQRAVWKSRQTAGKASGQARRAKQQKAMFPWAKFAMSLNGVQMAIPETGPLAQEKKELDWLVGRLAGTIK